MHIHENLPLQAIRSGYPSRSANSQLCGYKVQELDVLISPLPVTGLDSLQRGTPSRAQNEKGKSVMGTSRAGLASTRQICAGALMHRPQRISPVFSRPSRILIRGIWGREAMPKF
jgi:hypothetical protein